MGGAEVPERVHMHAHADLVDKGIAKIKLLPKGEIEEVACVLVEVIYSMKDRNHSYERLEESCVSLNLAKNNIVRLPSFANLPPTIKRLSVTENLLVEFPEDLPTESLEGLILQDNRLYTISSNIEKCSRLTLLDVAHNMLEYLPSLPVTLQRLYLQGNRFGGRIDLSYLVNLIDLDLGYSRLTRMPLLPSSIKTLEISGNKIRKLPDLSGLVNLKCFLCASNFIERIPELPPTLERFDCSSNPIKNFSTLPSSLKRFECYGTRINSLPTLPPNLEFLIASKNRLTVLPSLPKSLEGLYVSNNFLEELPDLPSNLISLYCGLNFLKTLPAIPFGLLELECQLNPIDELPELPWDLRKLTYGPKTLLGYEKGGEKNCFCTSGPKVLTGCDRTPENMDGVEKNCLCTGTNYLGKPIITPIRDNDFEKDRKRLLRHQE